MGVEDSFFLHGLCGLLVGAIFVWAIVNSL